MAEHGRDELKRFGRVIEARARASLMSDTKWRKLISELNKPERQLLYCIIKYIDSPIESESYFPMGLHPPRPWIEELGWGPTPLRSIEWMLVPRVAIDKRGSGNPQANIQDIDSIALVLERLGKYPMQISSRGLLITGHLTKSSI